MPASNPASESAAEEAPQGRARILAIAGSDSGGGAGIQADIKTVTALGGFATTAITALTVQNTHGVADILDVPPAFVAAQVSAVLGDIGADAIKTGMVSQIAVMEAIAPVLDSYTGKLVVDPVMVASSGDRLLRDDAVSALKSLLLRRADLATPNMPEAEVLTGRRVETLDDMKFAADKIMDGGARAALIKGGHGEDRVLFDLLAMQTGFEVFEHERLLPPDAAVVGGKHSYHGTGCSLASAIATGLGQGLALTPATNQGINYIQAAITKTNKKTPIGTGYNKPLDHVVE